MFGQRLKCHFRRTTLSLVYSAASVAAAVVLGGAVSTASGAVTLTPLGDLPGGQFDSRATAVSADGSIVFGTTNTASGTQTFRWSVGTGMVSLGTLPGTTFSEPRSVSGDGSVLVGYSGNAFDHESLMNSGVSLKPDAGACGSGRARLPAVRETSSGC